MRFQEKSMTSQKMQVALSSARNFALLSELIFAPNFSKQDDPSEGGPVNRTRELVSQLSLQELKELKVLAEKNHVILRSFAKMRQVLEADDNAEGAEWAASAIEQEQERINHALTFLAEICAALEAGGCQPIVIKSLDHGPDLGSDLDLYTSADSTAVAAIMKSSFRAQIAPRSWGDRLANKWNFIVPGLPELVEIHIGRLGQTGEQTTLTWSLRVRSHAAEMGSYRFQVPAPEERIVISTLQRMYRHFYIRLCDMVDNFAVLASGQIDFSYLYSLGSETGLWEGIATYLTIVADYVESYRGHASDLPSFIRDTAKTGIDRIHFGRDFLRVPIVPDSLRLYATELKRLLLNGDIRNSFRLSLLPCLATAAAIEQKITGSDKGIW
jgi:hypothetical protein